MDIKSAKDRCYLELAVGVAVQAATKREWRKRACYYLELHDTLHRTARPVMHLLVAGVAAV